MRDYRKIKQVLFDTYEIEDFDKKFESTALYRAGMSDTDYIKAYVRYYMGLNEDATATMGNTSGMGAVVTAQPGAIPGTTGTTGSGDVGAGSIAGNKENNPRNVRKRDNHLPRSRRGKKEKAVLKSAVKNRAEASSPKEAPKAPKEPATHATKTPGFKAVEQTSQVSPFTHKMTRLVTFSDFGKAAVKADGITLPTASKAKEPNVKSKKAENAPDAKPKAPEAKKTDTKEKAPEAKAQADDKKPAFLKKDDKNASKAPEKPKADAKEKK